MKTQFFVPAIFISMLLVTPLAHADSIEAIKAASPNATPYEILAKLYNEATSPASVDDFDGPGIFTTMRCARADKGSLSVHEIDSLRRFSVKGSGGAAEGPLFPVTPEQSRTVLLVEKDRNKVEQLAPGETLATTATDLIVKTTCPAGVSCEDGFPYQLYLRKSGDLIAIKAELDVGTSSQTEMYAYCWHG
ncbi:MAG: hypothetical protein P4M08_09750 [Oligoflexia bacterium]|nr:hypothetical protein [Oligoflexia bacterium]